MHISYSFFEAPAKHTNHQISWPASIQCLITRSLNLNHDTLLSAFTGFFPSCTLLLRLRADKGGFCDAGRKKSNILDAYHEKLEDVSGVSVLSLRVEFRLDSGDLSGDVLLSSSPVFGGGGSSCVTSPQAIRAASSQPVTRLLRGRTLVLLTRFRDAAFFDPPKPTSAGAGGKLKQSVTRSSMKSGITGDALELDLVHPSMDVNLRHLAERRKTDQASTYLGGSFVQKK